MSVKVAFVAFGAVLATILAPLAEAQTPAHLQNPWVRRPTAEEAATVIPPSAIKPGGLRTTPVRCVIARDGRLNDCVATSSRNEHLHAAAVGGMAFFQLDMSRPQLAASVGEPILIYIVFDVGGPPPHNLFARVSAIGPDALKAGQMQCPERQCADL